MLGINVRDYNQTIAQDFKLDNAVTYPSIYDPPFRIAAALGGVPTSVIPTTIVLDRSHRPARVPVLHGVAQARRLDPLEQRHDRRLGLVLLLDVDNLVAPDGRIIAFFLLSTIAKVQSALLEAMEERQVSVDGKTYRLPQPFLVVATQNPSEQLGTFPLPESQLDRFMMRLSMGYPAEEAEKALYRQGGRRHAAAQLQAVATPQQLAQWQQQVRGLTVSDAVAAYVYRLVAATRRPGLFVTGLSPRAGLSLLAAAKAWAFLEGRDFVLPEDLKAVWVPVANHRLQTLNQRDSADVLNEIVAHVAV